MRLFQLLVLATLASLTASVSAQTTDLATQPAEETDETSERAKQLFDQFAEDAASLSLATEATDEQFELIQTPLFRFSAEGTVFGSVYVWQDAAKRLAVIGTIGSIPIQGVDMEFVELHLLKPEPITPVTIPGRPAKRWNPDVTSLKLNPIPGAPAVAASERARMVQMRAMARMFSAEMRQRDQTHQLRLLPQPLYRYANSTQDRDGGLFAFVWDTGTDPELVLRIETVERDGEPAWHYQPIRFTWRDLKLFHKKNEIWHVEEFVGRDSSNQTTPYITGLTKLIP